MKEEAQDIEALRARYQRLATEKTIAETNLRNAAEQLNRLRQQAEQEYGTSDMAALSAKLQAMREDNARKTRDYAAHLDEIEADLARIEADPAVAADQTVRTALEE